MIKLSVLKAVLELRKYVVYMNKELPAVFSKRLLQSFINSWEFYTRLKPNN